MTLLFFVRIVLSFEFAILRFARELIIDYVFLCLVYIYCETEHVRYFFVSWHFVCSVAIVRTGDERGYVMRLGVSLEGVRFVTFLQITSHCVHACTIVHTRAHADAHAQTNTHTYANILARSSHHEWTASQFVLQSGARPLQQRACGM